MRIVPLVSMTKPEINFVHAGLFAYFDESIFVYNQLYVMRDNIHRELTEVH